MRVQTLVLIAAGITTVIGAGGAVYGVATTFVPTRAEYEANARADAEMIRDLNGQIDVLNEYSVRIAGELTQQTLERAQEAELATQAMVEEQQRAYDRCMAAGGDSCQPPSAVARQLLDIRRKTTRGLDRRLQCVLSNPKRPGACP